MSKSETLGRNQENLVDIEENLGKAIGKLCENLEIWDKTWKSFGQGKEWENFIGDGLPNCKFHQTSAFAKPTVRPVTYWPSKAIGA